MGKIRELFEQMDDDYSIVDDEILEEPEGEEGEEEVSDPMEYVKTAKDKLQELMMDMEDEDLAARLQEVSDLLDKATPPEEENPEENPEEENPEENPEELSLEEE